VLLRSTVMQPQSSCVDKMCCVVKLCCVECLGEQVCPDTPLPGVGLSGLYCIMRLQDSARSIVASWLSAMLCYVGCILQKSFISPPLGHIFVLITNDSAQKGFIAGCGSKVWQPQFCAQRKASPALHYCAGPKSPVCAARTLYWFCQQHCLRASCVCSAQGVSRTAVWWAQEPRMCTGFVSSTV
jgi:hypothetical protein